MYLLKQTKLLNKSFQAVALRTKISKFTPSRKNEGCQKKNNLFLHILTRDSLKSIDKALTQALKWPYLWHLLMDFNEQRVKMCRKKLFVFCQPLFSPCSYFANLHFPLGLKSHNSEFWDLFRNFSWAVYVSNNVERDFKDTEMGCPHKKHALDWWTVDFELFGL